MLNPEPCASFDYFHSASQTYHQIAWIWHFGGHFFPFAQKIISCGKSDGSLVKVWKFRELHWHSSYEAKRIEKLLQSPRHPLPATFLGLGPRLRRTFFALSPTWHKQSLVRPEWSGRFGTICTPVTRSVAHMTEFALNLHQEPTTAGIWQLGHIEKEQTFLLNLRQTWISTAVDPPGLSIWHNASFLRGRWFIYVWCTIWLIDVTVGLRSLVDSDFCWHCRV